MVTDARARACVCVCVCVCVCETAAQRTTVSLPRSMRLPVDTASSRLDSEENLADSLYHNGWVVKQPDFSDGGVYEALPSADGSITVWVRCWRVVIYPLPVRYAEQDRHRRNRAQPTGALDLGVLGNLEKLRCDHMCVCVRPFYEPCLPRSLRLRVLACDMAVA
jgi:hypothetical protein